jgi:hypothetical protein
MRPALDMFLVMAALVAVSLVLSLEAQQPQPAAPGAKTDAQRVNIHSNTERGGADVKQVPGRKIGNITTRGNVVLLELDSGVIADHHLFDLDGRTLRFTPSDAGFRAENLPLQWDPATGSALEGNTVRLNEVFATMSTSTGRTP